MASSSIYIPIAPFFKSSILLLFSMVFTDLSKNLLADVLLNPIIPTESFPTLIIPLFINESSLLSVNIPTLGFFLSEESPITISPVLYTL